MNAWMVITIVAIGVVVSLIVLKILHVILARRFDKDWERMPQEERWKLQSEARKKNI